MTSHSTACLKVYENDFFFYYLLKERFFCTLHFDSIFIHWQTHNSLPQRCKMSLFNTDPSTQKTPVLLTVMDVHFVSHYKPSQTYLSKATALNKINSPYFENTFME